MMKNMETTKAFGTLPLGSRLGGGCIYNIYHICIYIYTYILRASPPAAGPLERRPETRHQRPEYKVTYEASWLQVGGSWDQSGLQLEGLGAIWASAGGVLGPSGLQLEGSWGHLGSKLGGLGGMLAPTWGVLGPSWLQVEGLGALGSNLGGLGGILAPS